VPSQRKADYAAAQNVDVFIANSSEVQKRIKQYYNKPSTVIHPPVDVDRFTNTSQPLTKRHGYLAHGRQVPYKRVDLAVEACTALGLPLTVSGSGPEHDNLMAQAGKTVKFVSNLSDAEVAELFGSVRGFIFPAEEDFGIVQVEALAAGTPVIAYASGGSEDIVKPGEGGITFRKQNVISLENALKEAEQTTFQPANLQRIAKRFHKTLFITKLQKIIKDQS
jgi:glycosyltransferase involved in cell wall biosynthesis